MKKFFNEFKAFISRGNVMDLAVGVIIGAAFSAIVTSLVNDVIMPLIVWIFPVQDLASLSVTLREATDTAAALTWNYGHFIQAVINFLLTAFIVFVILKSIMKAKGVVSPKYGKTLSKKEYIAYRKQGLSKEEIKAIDDARFAEKEQAEKLAAEQEKARSTETLLCEIRDLLKENNDSASAVKEKKK